MLNSLYRDKIPGWRAHINFHKVCRNSMTPPKLPWNAPVSYSLHPIIPCLLKLFRNNFQCFCLNSTDSLWSHFVTLYIPEKIFLKSHTIIKFSLTTFIYHCGLIRGSTMSLDLLHTGTTIGLSCVPLKWPSSSKALRTALRASNLGMPCRWKYFEKSFKSWEKYLKNSTENCPQPW